MLDKPTLQSTLTKAMLITPLLIKHFVPELRESLPGSKVIGIRHRPAQKELILVVKGVPKVVGLLFNYDNQNYHFRLVNDSQIRRLDYPRVDHLFAELMDSFIAAVGQIDFDRILVIDFHKFDPLAGRCKLMLYCEISANLNLILTDRQHQILDSLKSTPLDSSSRRPIRPGLKYFWPSHPGKKNPGLLTESDWKELLESAPTETWRHFLATRFLGIDQHLADEILFRAKLFPESTVSAISQTETRRLHQHLTYFFTDKAKPHPNLVLSDTASPLFVSVFDLKHIPDSRKKSFSSLNQTVTEFFHHKNLTEELSREKGRILSLLDRYLSKLQGALQKVAQEMQEKSNYPEYKEAADLLMINKDALKKGMGEAVLVDLFSPAPVQRRIPLSPQLSPLQNAQSYYKKFQKAKAGLVLLEKRRKMLSESLTKLEALRVSTENSYSVSELEKIKPQLTRLGLLRPPAGPKASQRRQPKRRCRQFQTSEGWTVLVGRNNEENDLLTFKTARPEELWFHAANIPGSHVLLCREQRKSQPSPNTILETAAIAAYFSKGRNSKKVEVVYTQAKYVRKPHRAKPGLALVEKEKSVLVTPRLPETLEPSSKLSF